MATFAIKVANWRKMVEWGTFPIHNFHKTHTKEFAILRDALRAQSIKELHQKP